MAQKSREEGENEMLGVGRYPLEGNFSVSDKGWGGRGGTGNLTCTAIPLGLLGLGLVGLNRESMESNFDISEVTRCRNWR